MNEEFMNIACDISNHNVSKGGGPFGCVIVKNDEIVGIGRNNVTTENDPTAHAEIVAIRDACKKLNTFMLDECILYTSCEPCPMCYSAIHWARIPTVFYGNTKEDAANIGFDDDVIYKQLELPKQERSIKMINIMRDTAQVAFNNWLLKEDKVKY